MDSLVGLTTTREIYAELNGAPITGATFTYTLVGPTGTTVITAQSATEVGGGFYSYTIDGSTYLTSPGLYSERWDGSSGSTDLRFDGAFLVGYAAGPLVTRLDVRHQTADLLGDLWTGLSTGSNTSLTLKDTNLVQPDNHWRDAEVYVYGGAGRDQARVISSSTQTGGILTIGTAWVTNPDTTSYYELHKRFRVDQYNRAINAAIQTVAEQAFIPAVAETVLEVTDTVEYTIPAGFRFLTRVSHKDTTDTTGDWHELSRYHKEWDVVPGRGVLRLPYATTNWRVRLEGLLGPPLLLRDGAYADVRPDYLMYKAASLLVQGEIASPGADRRNAAQASAYYRDQANQCAPTGRGLKNSVRVA